MFVNTKHRYSVIVRVSVVFRKTCWTLTLPINRRKYINEYYNYQGWIVTCFINFFLAFLWRLVGVFTGVPGMHEINIMLAFTHAHNTHTLTPHARTRTLIFSEIFPTEDRESSNWWQSFWTCFGCPPYRAFSLRGSFFGSSCEEILGARSHFWTFILIYWLSGYYGRVF